MNWIKEYKHKITDNLGQYLRWLFIGAITGVVVGLVCALFSLLLTKATEIRTANPYMFLFLPLGGLLIVFLYKALKYENNKGTDSVIESIHSNISISPRMSILIFLSTIITILFGGSVGREGAALQIGSGIAKQMGDIFRFNDKDKKIIIMSGMSAAFSALFGTPMAAAFFSMEVSSLGILYYAALVPCICASLVAYGIVKVLKIPGESFHVLNDVSLSLIPGLKVILLAAGCAVISILFCTLLHQGSKLFKKRFTNAYIRIVVGGFCIIILTFLCGTQDYLGTGMPVIEHALNGNAVPWAFLLKIIFTVVTIAAGFKGGEIIPSLFIGATFGCAFGGMIGLPPSLGAAVGMVAVFCGVTNCPIASILIAFELFGFNDAYYYVIAIATSYMLSGYYSLYHTQMVVCSKYENKVLSQSTDSIL